ncbi:hypothetical protein BGW41_004730 [Actinomortierella wolfii]|nr:hypothetical protein BGW41_004730 [Actinomortierella wolfii]
MSSEQPTVRDYLQRAKTSLAEAIADLPAVSRGILGVSVAAYIINFFSNILYDRFSLDASAIVNGWQVYRLFTYTFTNPFLLSLIINMVVLLSVSSRMERALGTLPMAWVLLVTFTVLPGLLFVAVASLLDAIIGTSFSNLGMCGFDPVIFASIVLLSSQEGTGSFRLFGSYSIQAVCTR